MNIPRQCYKYKTGEEQIKSENIPFHEVEEIDYTSEILLYIKDCSYPWRGYTSDETMFATNQVKSLFIENIKILSKKQFILGTLYTLFNKKELQSFIDSFNRQSFRILSPYILLDEHLSDFIIELKLSIHRFMTELGLTDGSAQTFSEVFSHLILYDNAYRFRLMDLMSETTKEELHTPRKAILRLTELVRERDTVGEKYIKLAKILSCGLLLPRIKRAFIKMNEKMNIKKLQWDETDLYWSCLDPDYPFRGQSFKERKLFADRMNWTYTK